MKIFVDEVWPTVARGVWSQPTWRTRLSIVSPPTSSDAPVSYENILSGENISLWTPEIFFSVKTCWAIGDSNQTFNICIPRPLCTVIMSCSSDIRTTWYFTKLSNNDTLCGFLPTSRGCLIGLPSFLRSPLWCLSYLAGETGDTS